MWMPAGLGMCMECVGCCSVLDNYSMMLSDLQCMCCREPTAKAHASCMAATPAMGQ